MEIKGLIFALEFFIAFVIFKNSFLFFILSSKKITPEISLLSICFKTVLKPLEFAVLPLNPTISICPIISSKSAAKTGGIKNNKAVNNNFFINKPS